MSSVYNRNALYWEGTDTVYRVFWLILLFAKTGHAWSFDNWLRCRRLRKRGLLETSHGEGPPDPDDTRRKQPIYRLVPAWPRYLFLLQLAGLYCSTGTVKTGDVWAKGDALYYALNMDHFYRFEGLTQAVSSVFATNLFRVNTWVTHWWEMCFPLLIVGEVLRFGHLHRHEPWWRAQHRGWMEFGSAILGDIWGYETAKDEGAALCKAAALKLKFDRVERALSDGPFFAGERFSVVDAVFSPIFRYFDVFDGLTEHGI